MADALSVNQRRFCILLCLGDTVFPDDITEVDVDNEIILRDIDTKEDYLESINKIN